MSVPRGLFWTFLFPSPREERGPRQGVRGVRHETTSGRVSFGCLHIASIISGHTRLPVRRARGWSQWCRTPRQAGKSEGSHRTTRSTPSSRQRATDTDFANSQRWAHHQTLELRLRLRAWCSHHEHRSGPSKNRKGSQLVLFIRSAYIRPNEQIQYPAARHQTRYAPATASTTLREQCAMTMRMPSARNRSAVGPGNQGREEGKGQKTWCLDRGAEPPRRRQDVTASTKPNRRTKIRAPPQTETGSTSQAPKEETKPRSPQRTKTIVHRVSKKDLAVFESTFNQARKRTPEQEQVHSSRDVLSVHHGGQQGQDRTRITKLPCHPQLRTGVRGDDVEKKSLRGMCWRRAPRGSPSSVFTKLGLSS